MIIPIFQILYAVLFLLMIIASSFILFHILAYSYNTVSKVVMLLIFVPVVSVLLFSNAILFLQIPLDQFFSNF